VFVRKYISRLKRFYNAIVYKPRQLLRQYVTQSDAKLIRLGTEYGGWTIADTPELKHGVAVLCGAGEDVSFDLALQKRYGCAVLTVDPTPRAIEHYRKLAVAFAQNGSFPINNGNDNYEFDGVDLKKITYIPTAIWHCNASLKFWVPLNDDHVSHSLTNLQGTQRYIEVRADTLSAILAANGFQPTDLTLLKIDIEGAEAAVIDWICDNAIFPQQILVEFDDVHFPNAASNKKIKEAVERLLECGYRMVYYDGVSNCLFLQCN